jgi:uncharacterized protein
MTNMPQPEANSGRSGNQFHVLIKPTGAVCNLDCSYCFYLDKESLYPGSTFRMSVETAAVFLQQLIEAHGDAEIFVSWQGGEPTLMGLDFYRAVMEREQQYRHPGVRIRHTMQTNGVLLNAAWCEFFREHQFLIGISIDGPQPLHDAYRHAKGGQPTFAKVFQAVELLRRHGVAFNALTTVHAGNGDHPLAVYRFLRDEAAAAVIQFIPIVSAAIRGHTPRDENDVAPFSVRPEQYGRFLISVFDEWLESDVGRVQVQPFEATLANWLGVNPGICVYSPVCGRALALEHTGDLYSCDHFVTPHHRLGNIHDRPLAEMVALPQQQEFGLHKLLGLPGKCQACAVRFACNGGCPKDSFLTTEDGEPGLNYLCAGYEAFYRHAAAAMHQMADLLRAGYEAAAIRDLRHLTAMPEEAGAVADTDLLFGETPLV